MLVGLIDKALVEPYKASKGIEGGTLHPLSLQLFSVDVAASEVDHFNLNFHFNFNPPPPSHAPPGKPKASDQLVF